MRWTSRFVILTIAVAGLCLGSLAAAAQISAQAGERASLSGDLADIGFAAGRDVEVSAVSSDDVLAAGGNVNFRGASADHIFGAGGMLTFDNFRASDVFAAGGDIRFISGATEDDLVAMGGDIVLHNGFSVAGSAIVGGGEIRILAPIGRDLRAGGGRVELDASVGGNAEIDGDTVVIGPNTRIAGKLTHRARSIDISSQAVITGGVTALPPHEGWRRRAGPQATVTSWLFGMVSLIVLSCAAVLLAPGLIRDAERSIREHPLPTAGIGIVVAIAAPLVLLLLAVTVIGLPVAFVLLMLLLATLPLAIAAFVYFAGAWTRKALKRPPSDAASLGSRIGWTALAAAVISIVLAIPWVGWLAWLVICVMGVGAIATQGGRALFRGAGAAPMPQAA